LAAAATPTPAGQPANPLGPPGIVIVDHFRSTHGADSFGAGRTRGGDHPGTAHDGKLHNQSSGDAARAVNQQGFAGLHGQRVVDHLRGSQRRNGEYRRVRPCHTGWLAGAISGGADRLFRPGALLAERHAVREHLVADAEHRDF